MTSTENCPQGRSQDLTFAESDDKILVDRKIFEQVFFLLLSSVDEVGDVRHREIFLKSLDRLFISSRDLDVSESAQAALLLGAYCDDVFPSLAEIDSNLEEVCKLMREVKDDKNQFT